MSRLKPAPVLETTRLRLRQHQPANHAALHAILSDPVTMQFWPAPFTPEQTQGWIERQVASYAARGYGRWAVERAADGALIVGGFAVLLVFCTATMVVDGCRVRK